MAIRRLLRLFILAIVSIVMAVIIACACVIFFDETHTSNDVSKSADVNNVPQDYVEDYNLKQAEVTKTEDERQKQEIGVDIGIVTDITYIDGTPLAVIKNIEEYWKNIGDVYRFSRFKKKTDAKHRVETQQKELNARSWQTHIRCSCKMVSPSARCFICHRGPADSSLRSASQDRRQET